MCSERGEWDVVVALVVLVHARGCVVDVSVQRGMPFRVFDFNESGGLVGLLVRYHSGCIQLSVHDVVCGPSRIVRIIVLVCECQRV
jgi:hypothetical protein